MYDWSSMKKFVILIPIYNDWKSLIKLLEGINKNIKNIRGAQFDCIIVNDCSTIINPKIKISPGQSQLHYSPGIPLKMNVIKPKKNEAFILVKKRKIKLNNYFYLSTMNNLNEAAKNLYSCLRKIKNKGYKSIAVEKISNKGLGKAINDRLLRASKY